MTALHHGGMLCATGKVDVWRQKGCLASHEGLLRRMMGSGVPAYVACEEDLVLGKTRSSPVEAGDAFRLSFANSRSSPVGSWSFLAARLWTASLCGGSRTESAEWLG